MNPLPEKKWTNMKLAIVGTILFGIASAFTSNTLSKLFLILAGFSFILILIAFIITIRK